LWIDHTEVTNAQFAAFVNDQGNQKEGGYTWLEVEQVENCQIEHVGDTYRPENGKADYPVVEVSWYGATAYCTWVVFHFSFALDMYTDCAYLDL
jgi:formylglycine-generating enzyme required for sulfatase activity